MIAVHGHGGAAADRDGSGGGNGDCGGCAVIHRGCTDGLGYSGGDVLGHGGNGKRGDGGGRQKVTMHETPHRTVIVRMTEPARRSLGAGREKPSVAVRRRRRSPAGSDRKSTRLNSSH